MGPVTITCQSENKVSELSTVKTYTDLENYWAPLYEIDDNDNKTPADKMANAIQHNNKTTSYKQQHKELLCKWLKQTMQLTTILDSGAKSHFIQAADNLPKLGESDKIVHLPDK